MLIKQELSKGKHRLRSAENKMGARKIPALVATSGNFLFYAVRLAGLAASGQRPVEPNPPLPRSVSSSVPVSVSGNI
ncbi:MAG: hypothetical protein KH847_00155, partial [Clostridiales bacterium]|nr:hypothetical protein [Clostridiales bacterium]